jgi:hypothetical protein
MKKCLIACCFSVCVTAVYAQPDSKREEARKLDNLYIDEVEDLSTTDKVLHAEPIFTDLIRDLGARKGEHEWNLGMGITDNQRYDYYSALLEYEFAPLNRLGLEIEAPFSFYYPNTSAVRKDSIPATKLNSLKTAVQYTFFVSEKMKTSMAIGYINEVLLADFKNYRKHKVITGNGYNPFFVGAKRWGSNFHSLLYSGPIFHQHFVERHITTEWQINSNFHYMIPGTRNFVGVELNKSLQNTTGNIADFAMTVRPQMRVSISDNLLAGIAAGIPVSRNNERFSSFIRLIYEPGSKHQR